MHPVITVTQFVVALLAAVAERGRDFRYQDCYSDNDSPVGCVYRETSLNGDHTDKSYPELPSEMFRPACLIGWIAHYHGFLNLLREGGVTEHGNAEFFTPQALNLATLAQGAQDGGSTWGDAADNVMRRLAEWATVQEAEQKRISEERAYAEQIEAEAEMMRDSDYPF